MNCARDETPAVPEPTVERRLLVAVDVDGTLLDTEFEDRLRLREIEAIEAVRAAGHEVALCTGRNSRSVAGLLKHSNWHPTDLPLVLLNGAVIMGGRPYRRLVYNVLEGQIVKRLVEIFHAHDALAMVYDTEERGGRLHHEQREANDILSRYLQLRRDTVGAIIAVPDLLDHLPSSAMEVGTIDRRELVTELSEEIRRELGDQVRVINTQSLLGGGKFYWAEVYHPTSDKGTAVKVLARELGVAATDVIAIGDNYNDLDMFEAAAYSVAMSSGPVDVQQAADLVAPPVAESGGAEILESIAGGNFPVQAKNGEDIR